MPDAQQVVNAVRRWWHRYVGHAWWQQPGKPGLTCNCGDVMK